MRMAPSNVGSPSSASHCSGTQSVCTASELSHCASVAHAARSSSGPLSGTNHQYYSVHRHEHVWATAKQQASSFTDLLKVTGVLYMATAGQITDLHTLRSDRINKLARRANSSRII